MPYASVTCVHVKAANPAESVYHGHLLIVLQRRVQSAVRVAFDFSATSCRSYFRPSALPDRAPPHRCGTSAPLWQVASAVGRCYDARACTALSWPARWGWRSF